MSYHTDFVSYLEERNLWFLVWIWWPIRACITTSPTRSSSQPGQRGAKLARHGIRATAPWRRGLPEWPSAPLSGANPCAAAGGPKTKKSFFSAAGSPGSRVSRCTSRFTTSLKDGNFSPAFVLLGRGPAGGGA